MQRYVYLDLQTCEQFTKVTLKKSNSGSKNHSKKVIDFNEVVDCVVINDDNENEPAINGNNHTTLLSGEFTDLTNIFVALMSKIG